MSYVFAVTKRIDETDVEKAFNQLKILREQEENASDREGKVPNKDLVDFVNYIRLKYPCLNDFDEMDPVEAEEYEEIWGDGPLLNNITGDVFTFSLLAGYLEEPLEYIIEEANKRGFTIFWYEEEQIFHP